MREIVERDPQEGGDSENLDDVGAACHRYNSNLRDADIVHGADSASKKVPPIRPSSNPTLSLSFELMSKEPPTPSASAFSFPSKRLPLISTLPSILASQRSTIPLNVAPSAKDRSLPERRP
jgi:hypothetical protein